MFAGRKSKGNNDDRVTQRIRHRSFYNQRMVCPRPVAQMATTFQKERERERVGTTKTPQKMKFHIGRGRHRYARSCGLSSCPRRTLNKLPNGATDGLSIRNWPSLITNDTPGYRFPDVLHYTGLFLQSRSKRRLRETSARPSLAVAQQCRSSG